MEKNLLLESGYALTSVNEKRKPGMYLWGEFMHGDADAYTKECISLETIEELEGILKYLVWRDSMSHNVEIDYRTSSDYDKKEKDFYAQAGEEFREDDLWDGVLDWWPNDVTYNDISASLQKTWVIFVDEDGKEYSVTKIGGK